MTCREELVLKSLELGSSSSVVDLVGLLLLWIGMSVLHKIKHKEIS